jgi:putative Ca2+/H+ antiporter (TMEM165/GDT1 family)
VAGRWTSILVSLAAAMLLIVLVDGWAIAFLPRVVEKIVISAAFIVLVVVAVQELKGRDRQRA